MTVKIIIIFIYIRYSIYIRCKKVNLKIHLIIKPLFVLTSVIRFSAVSVSL